MRIPRIELEFLQRALVAGAIVLLLAACERQLGYDEIKKMKEACRQIGGEPVTWAHLNGSVAQVTCEPK